MWPGSLSGQLVLSAVAALAVAGIVVGTVVWLIPDTGPSDRLLRAELQDEVAHLQDGLRVDATGAITIVLDGKRAKVYDAMPKDAAYQVLDATGATVAMSAPGPALQALQTMRPEMTTRLLPNGRAPVTLQVVQQPITHGKQRFVVRVARSDRLVTTLRAYAGKLYVRAGVVTVLLALATFALVVLLTVQRMVMPLRRASVVAASIGPRNLAARLHVQRMPSELVPLVEAFNAALVRLEQGYRVQQAFLASAAHELKTPLALLQAEIELGGAADPELLLRDTTLMARQVHQLLHLAEVSEGHNYSFAPIELGAVLAEVVDYFERVASTRAVHLELVRQADAASRINADAAAVFVLAKNLLENALNHAPTGSVVRVQVNRRGFWVQDAGPGVAAADRPQVFQRFWRGQRDGPGAGLGLAICHEICAAHHWRICLEDTEDGSGARFSVVMAMDAGGSGA